MRWVGIEVFDMLIIDNHQRDRCDEVEQSSVFLFFVPEHQVAVVTERNAVSDVPAVVWIRAEWQDVMNLQSLPIHAETAVSAVPFDDRFSPSNTVRIHPFALTTGPEIVPLALVVFVPASSRACPNVASILDDFARASLERFATHRTNEGNPLAFPRRAAGSGACLRAEVAVT